MLWTAPWIFTPQGWLTDHVLETDGQGLVQALRPLEADDQPESVPGVLCPGLINAHCHLELSALQGNVEEGTGMTGFIQAIFAQRGAVPPAESEAAVATALATSYQQGTVAIGDICNSPLSLAAKRAEARVWTHSFVEVLGLDPARAGSIFEGGKALAAQFEGLSTSLTAHAPYSMSSELLDLLGATDPGDVRSIHLLESQVERELFEEKKGAFIRFFERLNLPYQGFASSAVLDHITSPFAAEAPIIWVHLTEATAEELAILVERFPQSHFCLCPRSNYFIHRRYPALDLFAPYTDRICLGTDSLASNHDLDMVSEMRALQALDEKISLHTLLRWTSTQGAIALGQGHRLGAFRPGTRPGIIRLGPLGPGGTLLPATQAVPIE